MPHRKYRAPQGTTAPPHQHGSSAPLEATALLAQLPLQHVVQGHIQRYQGRRSVPAARLWDALLVIM